MEVPSATTREEIASSRYAVTSSHRLVSETGARVLERGGTAMDAALAMAAMTFVTLPGQCGVGGDAFCVWYDAVTGAYHAVSGSGVGPDGADASFFSARALSAIPLTGPLAVAVPGEMAAISSLHRAAATRPLGELWAPAIALARDGTTVTKKLHEDIEGFTTTLSVSPDGRAVFLPHGAPPALGATVRQEDLASTLERLAETPEDFYEGELATRCLEHLDAAGAPFSGREWRATRAPVTSTLTGSYRGLALHESRLPSPGYMVLQQAAVLDGLLAEAPWLGSRALGHLAGAAALAFRDRRTLVGSEDPTWASLLEPEAVASARRQLLEGGVPATGSSVAAGDTTSVVAVDAMGNAVSFIHSLAYTFGSGVMVPGTGVVLNDRLGRGAYLDPGHPNALRPGRRPMHTLNAWIVAGPTGRPAYVGNTPGGDGQVQWNMQLLSHLLDYGLSPQQAVEAPRFTVYPGSDADAIGQPSEVRYESRLEETSLEGLRAAGTTVVREGPWTGGGSAQIIAIDHERGVLRAGSDPRFDGAAIGG